jgi:hypothetical protein
MKSRALATTLAVSATLCFSSVVLAKVTVKDAGDMRQTPPHGIDKATLNDGIAAIKQLRYEHLPGGKKSHVVPLPKGSRVRIDRQDPSKTHQNIQVQINGSTGASTVATVLIPFDLLKLNKDNDPKGYKMSEVEKRAREALGKSLNTVYVRGKDGPRKYELTGKLSN